MISARELSKVFRPPGGMRELLRGRLHGPSVTALAGVSLEVVSGEIVCVMGPNGAGKTTLLRLLAGLLLPTSGASTVAGLDPADSSPAFRREVSLVVGDERSFFWTLTGRENLLFHGALHGLSRAEARRRAGRLLEAVGLAATADRRFHTYSRGMKQRLALARGLLGTPRVLLLDEPTLGLDPAGARELRRFLRDEVVRGPGRTALVGSNDPLEVRALADRVVFLEAGRVSAVCAPDRLDEVLGPTDA